MKTQKLKVKTYVNIKFVFLFLCTIFICSFGQVFAKGSITTGKGIWVNIWNYPENPDMFCEYLRSKGIDTIYLQVSRSNTSAIKDPIKLNKIIKSAHERSMKVIGWSYVFLKNPLQDANKYIQAVFYKTPEGDSLDGLAADIEEVTNSTSIEVFAKAVRKAAPKDYPLIAITYSPLLKRADPKYYAWRTIANNFDIIAPMTYWHGFVKYRSEKGAYDYTLQTISKIKEFTQRDDLKIHLIGDGQKTNSNEITGFLKAAEEQMIDGGVSLYPWYKPQDHQIDALGKFKI